LDRPPACPPVYNPEKKGIITLSTAMPVPAGVRLNSDDKG